METAITTTIPSSITPRDYQFKHIDKIIANLGKHRKTIAQLPTGGGKTVEFALIIHRYLQKNPDKSVLILVHRVELLEQARRTLYRMFGIDASLIVQGVKSVLRNRVYIGMVESVNTRQDKMELLDLGLVIIDECHVGNFIKMHEVFMEEYIIGFTATPVSASKKHPMVKYFDSIACGPSIKELIRLGYLAQNVTRCPTDIVDERRLMYDQKTGDFDIRSMAMEYSKPKYVMNTVMYYNTWCKGQKTLIFNVNIEHSKDVELCFQLCGFKCKHLDGTTPQNERDEILRWFKETPDAILCNVGIVGVGFDEPTIKNIILNFHTTSVVKFLQCAGRGGRMIDETFIEKFQKDYPYKLEEKHQFNIIDLGGNAFRVGGDWNDERDWEYMFYNPERPPRPGTAPMKTCPKCKGLVHAATIVCKLPIGTEMIWNPETAQDEEHEVLCGNVFDRRKYEEEVRIQNLVVITKNIKMEDIMEAHKGKRLYYPFFEMGRMYASKVAEFGFNLDEKQIESIVEDYYGKCEEWFRKVFPGKRYNEKWHRSIAREHFYTCLQNYRNQLTK